MIYGGVKMDFIYGITCAIVKFRLVVWNILFFHNIWDNSGYISITQLYMELLLVGGDWNMAIYSGFTH